MKATNEQMKLCLEGAIQKLDIDKIHSIMNLMDIQWPVVGIPSKEEILNHLRDLSDMVLWKLDKLPDGGHFKTFSAGFEVEVWDENDVDVPAAYVKFIPDFGYYQYGE